ncbi:MAG: cyclodeaminase/cyclohydrolase family protein, partial [Clostridiales bacterium]|nr:cyclodeaminase/cyclohydrolase family protein [Clostridiales bacterium]
MRIKIVVYVVENVILKDKILLVWRIEMMYKEYTINDFMSKLASDSSSPGGGSVAALVGAAACGLISMVASLTIGKKGYEENQELMHKIIDDLAIKREEFLNAIDEDPLSYEKVIECYS